MKFLADENFPMPSVFVLREAGHKIEHVGVIARSAIDEDVVALANKETRTVLTFDADIGTLAIARKQPVVAGIIYFRLVNYKPETPAQMLLDHLKANPETDFAGRITVFDPPRVRQRKFE